MIGMSGSVFLFRIRMDGWMDVWTPVAWKLQLLVFLFGFAVASKRVLVFRAWIIQVDPEF